MLKNLSKRLTPYGRRALAAALALVLCLGMLPVSAVGAETVGTGTETEPQPIVDAQPTAESPDGESGMRQLMSPAGATNLATLPMKNDFLTVVYPTRESKLYNSKRNFYVQAKGGEEGISTTNSDQGYFVHLRESTDDKVLPSKFLSTRTLPAVLGGNLTGLTVSSDFEFVYGGKQVKVSYIVENSGSNAISFDLATGADVIIGYCSMATVKRTPTGFRLISTNAYGADKGKQLNISFENIGGADPTHSYIGDIKIGSPVEGKENSWVGYMYTNNNVETLTGKD